MDTYKRAYRKLGNQGLFDSEERTSMLNALGNPLERLSETIDFEMFRGTLEAGLYRERLTKAGAKPYDYVLMFKILVLQRMYNLSDEQTEYQIVDRTSFWNFLGLTAWDVQPRCRFGAKMLKIEVPYTVSHLNNHAHVLEYIIVQHRSPQYGWAG